MKNVPGNYYDKHGSRNPLVRWLMRNFHDHLIEEIANLKPTSILDVGCGEGHTTNVLSEYTKDITGVDLEESVIRKARKTYKGITFRRASANDLPFEDDSFDIVVSTEMLEHVEEPERALKEMKRVSKRGCVFTVPNEPWWRIANMMRGAYVKDLGNTPGHLNHWSYFGFRRFLRAHFDSVRVKNVVMWNLAVCIKRP